MHTVLQLARGTRRVFLRLYELGVVALLLGAVWAAGVSVAPLFDDDDGVAPPMPAYCGNSQSSTVVMHR